MTGLLGRVGSAVRVICLSSLALTLILLGVVFLAAWAAGVPL